MLNKTSSRLTAIYSLLKAKSPSELAIYQEKQLQKIVRHAYENVPYYQKLFQQHNITPQKIKTLSDLPLIPITDRPTIQACKAEEIIANGLHSKNLLSITTGGSSGIPLTVYRSWVEERLLNQFRWRALHSYGLKARDKICYVRFAYNTPGENQSLQQVIKKIGYYQTSVIDCLQPISKIIDLLAKSKADVIVCFPVVMQRVAQMMLDEGKTIASPKFIAIGGEVLTQEMKATISQAFQAPVFNTYGSNEFNLIAWECPVSRDLHLCQDNVIVEILKNGQEIKSGESGEIVVTGLNSFSMPFIRYRLADLVTKGDPQCSCGQPFPTIKQVIGRMNDYLILPDGQETHPLILLPIIRSATWIKGYRLIQEKPDYLILNVIISKTPSNLELESLKEKICLALKAKLQIDINFVDELTLEKSGKFRIFQSRVKSAYK